MMARLDVKKTHKLFINGEFPRSESGRTFPALDESGAVIARMAEGSRKDLRDAVRAARNAQEKWAARTGYNRGQILYRVAEMIEDRVAAFTDDLRSVGGSKRAAEREVDETIDRLVWYAGWCDKFAQVHGNLNPVAGPFFNISSPEPTGVVGIIAPAEPALLGLVSRLAPVLVPGNTAVVVASDTNPVVAVTFAEALATSDVPPGVVNILTGHAAELTPWLASHMDVNAIDLTGADSDLVEAAEVAAADNVKRVIRSDSPDAQSPLLIAAFTETKTVWHPKGL
jgi:acyl-CoA reductase-like NAD-dependent aldehyde dehydrogenase